MKRMLVGFAMMLGVGVSADEPTGAALVVEKGCIACHSQDGVAVSPSYPNLAGQWEAYLRLQLMAYRSGKRNNAVMAGFASTLTDEEIRALAAYYGD